MTTEQGSRQWHSSERKRWTCVITLCRSPGCRADIAAVQQVADRNLCCRAGRLQKTDRARGQHSTDTAGCLDRERKNIDPLNVSMIPVITHTQKEPKWWPEVRRRGR